ncbi:MAG TPA: hypothetical protein VHD56_05485 [Tepidisphaeraceae bacterium]|nr:hypothetical protein [Tepidisphaeraceae bacterium]
MQAEKLPVLNDDAKSGSRLTFSGEGIALTLAAGLLGLTLEVTSGFYSPVGITLLGLSFVACAVAVLWRPSWKIQESHARILLASIACAQLIVLLCRQPRKDLFDIANIAIAVAGLILITFDGRRASIAGFLMLLAAFAGLGIHRLRNVPRPNIDVFMFHVDSAEALHHGENPYAITFPDFYGPSGDWVYGPGIVRNGRLQFGYPYPPLTLLLASAGYLLLGDPRYAMLLAMMVAAIFIALMRRDRIGMLAGAILLFTPRCLLILEMAWTEPLSVVLLAMTILSIYRQSRWTPFWFGLLIASKQYLVAAIVLILLVPRRESRRAQWSDLQFLVIGCAVALAVTLPIAAWNWDAFMYSVVKLQFHQPYRHDALSFLARWGSNKPDWQGPFWLAFATLAIAVAGCIWRLPRSAQNFVAAFALCFFAFFAFNKQAFANYYYLVLGAICCAIGSASSSADEI